MRDPLSADNYIFNVEASIVYTVVPDLPIIIDVAKLAGIHTPHLRTI